jgi:hypothetical protein
VETGWTSEAWRGGCEGLAGLDRLALGDRHGSRYQAILDVLGRLDPIGLAAESSLPDEYFPEAALIAERFDRVRSECGLRRLVHGVFVEMVGLDWAGDEARYDAAARAIWQGEARAGCD